MGDGSQFRTRCGLIVFVLFTVLTSVRVTADEAAEFPFPQCPENEFFRICLGNCTNCEQRGRCPELQCTESGCDCLPHYVRLTPGGVCEPVSKCPVSTCGENEIFRSCGPICETCGLLRCRILSCEHKCYCKEGFLRDFDGKCIPENECPPKRRCTIGEERRESSSEDEFCLQSDTEVVSNTTQTKEGCFCKPEHKRNLMGHCTSEDFCEFIKCRNIEKYNSCPPRCNTTCRNYADPTCEEDGQCYPGCFCPDGFLMNDHRACVRLEECPPGSNPLAPTAAPTTPRLTTETSNGDPTTSMTTTQVEDVTPTVSYEGTTGGTSENGKSGDAGEDSTVSDFSTVPYATTQKPIRAKHLKDQHAPSEARAEAGRSPTKAQKLKLVTPDFEDDNE